MKEEWLFPGAVVPVDMDTTLALVTEIKRLVNVIGGMALEQPAQEQEGPVADGWSINFSNGHSGLGVYAHLDEYPEEGAILLSGVPKWAIDAIKEVRAQPAQEPVAWVDEAAIREDERKEIRAQMTRLVIVPTLTHGTLVKLTDVDAEIRARGNNV